MKDESSKLSPDECNLDPLTRIFRSVTWDPNLRVIQLAASYEPPAA